MTHRILLPVLLLGTVDATGVIKFPQWECSLGIDLAPHTAKVHRVVRNDQQAVCLLVRRLSRSRLGVAGQSLADLCQCALPSCLSETAVRCGTHSLISLGGTHPWAFVITVSRVAAAGVSIAGLKHSGTVGRPLLQHRTFQAAGSNAWLTVS